jgi:hypothetical protein
MYAHERKYSDHNDSWIHRKCGASYYFDSVGFIKDDEGKYMKTKLKKIMSVGLFLGLAISHAWAEDEKFEDPASSRVIYGPTALPNTHAKKFRLTTFNLGLWELDYAANSNLNIGVQTAPPFGVFMFGGKIRYNHQLAENVHLGIYANAGILGTMVSSNTVAYYGGGPMLTLGNSKKALNISVLNYGARHENDSGWAMLPGIGGSIQVSDRLKLNMEGYLITTPIGTKFIRNAGAILYGVRIFSETGSVYGDINFLAPIFDGAGDLYRFMPLGIPVLAFGFSF